MEKAITINIPEGYVFSDTVTLPYQSEEVHRVVVSFKKKEVKDFNWYHEQYSKSINLFKTPFDYLVNAHSDKWNEIPFEYRMGLLKFICEDLFSKQRVGESMFYLLNKISEGGEFQVHSFRQVEKICPKEFINSLFE